MNSINQILNRGHRSPQSSWPKALVISFLAAVCLATRSDAQVYSLNNIWAFVGPSNNIEGSGGTDNRGMAYYAAGNEVFVVNKSTKNIAYYDGTLGTSNGAINISSLSGGNFIVGKIGFGTDGYLYGANLDTTAGTGSSAIKLYQWPTIASSPNTVYSTTAGDAIVNTLSGFRVGDTFAITGGGTNTLILMGANVSSSDIETTNYVIFSTANGSSFTPTVLEVTGLPASFGGGAQHGFCFYTNNSFVVAPNISGGTPNVYLVQYPSNFASLTSPVAATVIATNAILPSGYTWVDLSYNSAAGLLAVHENSQKNVLLYQLLSNNFSGATFLTSNGMSFSTSTTANGNETGAVALGGASLTNDIYTLDTGAGLQAAAILFTPAQPPVLSMLSGGITNAYPPEILSVSVTAGTPPFYYQWYVVSNSVTNIITGATNASYTNTAVVTNSYFVVVTNAAASGNVVTSAPTVLSLIAPLTNSAVASLWSAGVGTYANFLLDNDATRGIAYDTNTQRVVVSADTAAYVVDGNSGASLGSLSTTGLNGGGTFLVDQVGIADDGYVYGGNLAVAGQSFALNQWGSATNGAVAVQSFLGDPGQDGNLERWGDSMAVRGAGANTQIILGTYASTKVSLFTTPDGTNFSPTAITISGVSVGFSKNGIAFGSGDTFWAKDYLGDLFEIAYNTGTQTGTVVFDYTAGSQTPSKMSGVAVDMTNNILAGVDIADIHNDLQLFELTGSANPPVLFDQAFFPTYFVNNNDNAAVVMKYPRVYAVDSDNGIVALTYGVPATTAPTIQTQPLSQTNFAGTPVTFSVGASGSLPLYFQWQSNGFNILNATNQAYTISSATTNSAASYDVVVHNIAGSTNSAIATLTIILPVDATNYVSNLYTLPAGSRAYLDSSSYDTRGLGYDTNFQYLFLAEISGSIFVLNATNGVDVGQLNTAGIPAHGYSGFLLDQVGVGDDGVVYGANLANTANGDSFSVSSWTPTPADTNVNDYGINQAYPPASTGTNGADPGNGSGDRWGDDMAVRGAGVNTELLFGSFTSTNVALMTTLDGVNFTSQLLSATDPSVPTGFASLGIAFGPTNTFWAKGSSGYNLRWCSFDTNAGTVTVLQTYSAPTQTPNLFVGLSADVSAGLLGGVCLIDSPHDFQLYRTFYDATAPALFDQAFFGSLNPNGQFNAASVLKGGLGFALDVNNGLVAISYAASGALGPFSLTSAAKVSGPGFNLTWASIPGYTYQVQVATVLAGGGGTVWSNLGGPISATGTTTSYTDTTDAGLTAAYYQVIGY